MCGSLEAQKIKEQDLRHMWKDLKADGDKTWRMYTPYRSFSMHGVNDKKKNTGPARIPQLFLFLVFDPVETFLQTNKKT